jgi:phosphate transport system substrate-binding protein
MKLQSQALLAFLIASLVGCGGGANEAPSGPVQLKGAGATFPYVAYAKWFEEFKKADKNVDITYQQTGSEDGVKQYQAGTVDFAGTDIPLTDDEIAKSKVKPIHVPTLIGAVVPIYNIAGVSAPLNFTGEALAGILSGKIKRWNDPALTSVNPGVALPAAPIVVVHRADGSGTTYTLTDYLSKVSPEWKKSFGAAASVKWPVGETATGNEALAEKVKATPNSIGYVELNYAIANKINYGAVRNSAGKFRKADLEGLGAAVEAASKGDDFRASLTNPPSPNAYPICAFTYLIMPAKIEDPAKRAAMRHFLQWMTDKGQKMAMSLDYGVLPPELLRKVEDVVDRMR